MIKLLQLVVALLIAAAIAGPVHAQNGAATAEELVERARSAAAEGRPLDAWRALVALDGLDPEAWQQLRQIAQDAPRDLNNEARAAADSGDSDRALNIATIVTHERSLALIGKIYPQNVETLVDSMRQTQGIAWWKRGQREGLRGNRDAADENYRRALTFLQPGDRRYPQVLHDLAASQRDRGLELSNRGDRAAAEPHLRAAAEGFLALTTIPEADPQLINIAQMNVQQIAQAAGTIGIPGIQTPTPTPSPSPTPLPPPTMLEQLLGRSQGTGGFLDKLKEDGDLQSNILLWTGIIVGFILFFWVIPGMVLRLFVKKGDLRAGEALPKVRFLGPVALVLYAIWKLGDRRGSAATSEARHPCPHCGYTLDDPFAYEDLVFSRCPKCKGQITPLYSVESIISMLSNSLASDVERVNSGLSSLDKFVERDAMVRLVRAIITLAVRRRASDLHIEPDERQLVIRQRIDGMMTEMLTLPRSLALAFVSAVKISADLNIAERRKPQDGKMSFIIDKTEIDIRVASSPSSAGEKVSLRLLDCRSIQLEAKHLGMTPFGLDVFSRAITAPHGLVLVAGPTGSGKTTTLYVALQSLKTGAKNIISIEDPIEFRIPGVNQIQVNPTAGLTFASGLRSVLRQDPDVIMVGEIRDHETAEIAVNAATTGHLVFSTLHTIDASSSVARLIDLGVGARQFADALSLVIAQRLIRLICQNCAEEYVPTAAEIAELELPAGREPATLKRGTGCTVCNGTGYYRRIGIFEFLQPSQRLRSAIESEKLSTGDIRNLAISGGMRTMRQEGIALLLKGGTTLEEVQRTTK